MEYKYPKYFHPFLAYFLLSRVKGEVIQNDMMYYVAMIGYLALYHEAYSLLHN